MTFKQLSQSNNLIFNSVAAVFVFVVAVSVQSINLGHGLYVDELYHLLAAQSYLQDGSLRLAEGEYVRSSLYTKFIGVLFGIYGDSIEVARISSSVTMAFFLSVVYLSLAWLIGRKVALVSALIILILPSTIYLAQFVRFYAIHQLMFWIFAIGAYLLVVVRMSFIVWMGVAFITLAALFFAAYLQMTTLIALVGIYVWLTLYLCHQLLSGTVRVSYNAWILTALTVGGIVVMAALFITGKVSSIATDFRYAAPWSADNADNVLFYHRFLRDRFPTFWTLFPIACIAAVYKKPNVMSYFGCLFLVGVSIFSFGGMKDERYIIFLFPFAAVIWVYFAIFMFDFLKRMVVDCLHRFSYFKFNHLIEPLSGTIVLSVYLLILLSNQAFPLTFHLLSGKQYRHEIGDWSLSNDAIQALVDDASVVLTTNDVESQYYFGHYDFNFSHNILPEASRSQGLDFSMEFVIDTRTGRPVISSLESLELILNCYPDGVFLGDDKKWFREANGLGAKGVDLLSKQAKQVATNAKSGLVVFAWERSSVLSEKACKEVYTFKSR